MLVALEQLLSIEGATEIQMGCSFSRVHGFPYEGKALMRTNQENFPAKKVQPDKSRLHLLLTANIQRQLFANLILPYQAARSKKLVE